jgi:Gpi18-like mannosyltransferase
MKFQLKNFLKERQLVVSFYILGLVLRIFIAIITTFLQLIQNFSGSDGNQLLNQLLTSTLEPYFDYRFYYIKFANGFVYGGWLPYLSNMMFNSTSVPFVYPPLFLYILSLPALININLVFLPLFLADILLPIIVYKFLIKSTDQKVAEWGLLATVLCPLTIFYTGGLFLNTSLVTLFFIIALYFLSIKKYNWVTFFLAIAILSKQTAIFFLYPILTYIFLKLRETNQTKLMFLKKSTLNLGILVLTLFLGSLPWILIAPEQYLSNLSMGQNPTLFPEFVTPGSNWPLNWYSFLIPIKAPFWLLYLVGFLNFTLTGILVVELVDIYLLIRWYRKMTLSWIKILNLIVYTAILTHLFFPRGTYKYYFTFHVPLIVLWICFHYGESLKSDMSKWRKIFFLFLTISFTFLFMYKYFYLLIVWAIFFLMLSKNIQLNHKISRI